MMEAIEVMERVWRKLSEKQRQWTWFVILWCGGLGSVMLLGFVIRIAMGIE